MGVVIRYLLVSKIEGRSILYVIVCMGYENFLYYLKVVYFISKITIVVIFVITKKISNVSFINILSI